MTVKRKVIIAVTALTVLILIALAIYAFAVVLPQKRKEEQLLKALKEYYDEKIAIFDAENEKYDDYEVDVAFLGDSLTDGYDLKKYYPQYLTVNRGIGGDTTFGLEKRLKVSVFDLKPKVVVMLIGANNFDSMFNNYENILIALKDNLPSTKIVLLSLTSMGKNWAKNNQKAAYNNVKIKLFAEKYEFEFVDLYSPLLNLETGEIYEEYTTDGGHLTPKGYEVFTNTLAPVLKKLLGY